MIAQVALLEAEHSRPNPRSDRDVEGSEPFAKRIPTIMGQVLSNSQHELPRPLKTVIEFQELRDSIAHGKAERFSGTLDHDADIDELMPSLPNSKIRSMVLPKGRLDEVLEDVRSLLDRMHPAVAAIVDDAFFKATAVGGPAAWMSRSTGLK